MEQEYANWEEIRYLKIRYRFSLCLSLSSAHSHTVSRIPYPCFSSFLLEEHSPHSTLNVEKSVTLCSWSQCACAQERPQYPTLLHPPQIITSHLSEILPHSRQAHTRETVLSVPLAPQQLLGRACVVCGRVLQCVEDWTDADKLPCGDLQVLQQTLARVCVAVCCSVFAECCNVPQFEQALIECHVAFRWRSRRHLHTRVLQCVAECCGVSQFEQALVKLLVGCHWLCNSHRHVRVLRCVAVSRSVLQCKQTLTECHVECHWFCGSYWHLHEQVCCSVLQCVAVRCSVLQCVAMCCRVLLCVAVCCRVLPCVAVCCSVLQCVAVCRSVSQCVAVWKGAARAPCTQLQFLQTLFAPGNWDLAQCVAVCCCVLQRVAACCSVLQCVANVLQCVAV